MPAVVTATAAPAFAVSGTIVLKITQPYYNDKQQRFVFTVSNNGKPVSVPVVLRFYNLQTGKQMDVNGTTGADGTGFLVIENGQYQNVYLKNYTYVVVIYDGVSSPALELLAVTSA